MHDPDPHDSTREKRSICFSAGGSEAILMATVTTEAVPAVTHEVRRLIQELDASLNGAYLPTQRHGLSLESIFRPHIRFFVAKLDGAAMGCGGVALFSDFAEVKRMYVRPEARCKGLARALLARIERETSSAGLSRLCLETGDRQLEAIRLYERAGFRRCAAFGQYVGMARETIATSVFFEKLLSS